MDLQLDDSGDLAITDGNLVLLEDNAAIRQHIRIALNMYRGEWFLNTSEGVPWIQTIFRKGTSLAVVTAVLRNAILAVPGVTEIKTFDVAFDATARRVSLSFDAVTPDGQTIVFRDYIVNE